MMFAIGAGMILFASFSGMAPLDRYILPAVPFLVLVGVRGFREIGEIKGIWGKIIISIFLFAVFLKHDLYLHILFLN